LRALGGKPISAATIEVLAEPTTGGQPLISLGHTTTHVDGQFKATLPPGTSRRICLRYGPEHDGRYAAALLVSQQVSAGVNLRVRPNVIDPNGTIILTGSVLGGHLPQAGKVVELQVLYFGVWRVFQTVRSKPSGEFTSFYSFLGGHGKFAFRARVRAETGYPYSLGYSRPAAVIAGGPPT
jgi:hypothetical protein